MVKSEVRLDFLGHYVSSCFIRLAHPVVYIAVRRAAQDEPAFGGEGREAADADAARLRARRLPLPARGGRHGARRVPQARRTFSGLIRT